MHSLDNTTIHDLSHLSDQARGVDLITVHAPQLVMLSPPCTTFSIINGLNKFKVPAETRERRLTEGKVLLNFVLDVYTWQHRRGKYFIHEHPQSASSWELPEVRAVQ